MPEARNPTAIEVSCVRGNFFVTCLESSVWDTAGWYELVLPLDSVNYKPSMNLDGKSKARKDL